MCIDFQFFKILIGIIGMRIKITHIFENKKCKIDIRRNVWSIAFFFLYFYNSRDWSIALRQENCEKYESRAEILPFRSQGVWRITAIRVIHSTFLTDDGVARWYDLSREKIRKILATIFADVSAEIRLLFAGH